jgi:hypothetical protein
MVALEVARQTSKQEYLSTVFVIAHNQSILNFGKKDISGLKNESSYGTNESFLRHEFVLSTNDKVQSLQLYFTVTLQLV